MRTKKKNPIIALLTCCFFLFSGLQASLAMPSCSASCCRGAQSERGQAQVIERTITPCCHDVRSLHGEEAPQSVCRSVAWSTASGTACLNSYPCPPSSKHDCRCLLKTEQIEFALETVSPLTNSFGVLIWHTTKPYVRNDIPWILVYGLESKVGAPPPLFLKYSIFLL